MVIEGAVVSSKGQLVIPSRIRETMGIDAGTKVTFVVDGGRLILQLQTVAAKTKVIQGLRGITAGGPSMTDELLADRRAERARELAKDGW